MNKTKPIDFMKIKLIPIKSRKHKVAIADFAKPLGKNSTVRQYMNSLPDILAGRNFRTLVDEIINAKKKKKQVLFMMGGHVVKVGLGPIIIDLMKKGVITAVAGNGAFAIHDFEIALIGKTSEDVAENISDGEFGMVEETGLLMNMALIEGARKGWGFGESVGRKILGLKMKNSKYSVMANAVQLGIPVTIHSVYGAETIYQHPLCDGESVGKVSANDFRKFATIVAGLNNGGVVVNVGSAVVLPEVFLKALSIARNVTKSVKNFTAVNFDMVQHYRPNENVIRRPTLSGGKGISITGHHEIMIPLLACAVVDRI